MLASHQIGHRHWRKWPLCLLALFLLPSCAILGRQQIDQRLSTDAVSQVKKGMTKEEVVTTLGAPQEIIFSNKDHDPLREHAYVYEHQTTLYTAISLAILTFGNMDQKKDRVVVFFGDDETVSFVGASLHAQNAAYGFPFGR